jgi:hypothetical protein
LATGPRFVRLCSERMRQAVRQDCSFAKKLESPPALLVVVRGSSETVSGLAPAHAAEAGAALWFGGFETRGGLEMLGAFIEQDRAEAAEGRATRRRRA